MNLFKLYCPISTELINCKHRSTLYHFAPNNNIIIHYLLFYISTAAVGSLQSLIWRDKQAYGTIVFVNFAVFLSVVLGLDGYFTDYLIRVKIIYRNVLGGKMLNYDEKKKNSTMILLLSTCLYYRKRFFLLLFNS